jgi:hypothetical protein
MVRVGEARRADLTHEIPHIILTPKKTGIAASIVGTPTIAQDQAAASEDLGAVEGAHGYHVEPRQDQVDEEPEVSNVRSR